MRVLADPPENVHVMSEEEKIIFKPDEIKAGVIFYPGGKVEYESYAPLLSALAEKGYLCVLLHMPLNLAVLDTGGADGVREDWPEVDTWYIGGHSLGGVMAGSYAKKHAESFEGIFLLGAYLNTDVSDAKIRVLSIYGSEDGVLRRDKYEAAREYLPDEFEEHILEGGCHAFFGDYGAQQGDGTPFITMEEQILQSVSILDAWMDPEKPDNN